MTTQQPQTETFLFHDEINQLNFIQCSVTINVEPNSSNNNDVYEITFKYQYRRGVDVLNFSEILAPHPFADMDIEMQEFSNGALIIKNSMTEEMVKYMLMEDSELTKYSGLSTPQHYRTHIIHNLVRLWD